MMGSNPTYGEFQLPPAPTIVLLKVDPFFIEPKNMAIWGKTTSQIKMYFEKGAHFLQAMWLGATWKFPHDRSKDWET